MILTINLLTTPSNPPTDRIQSHPAIINFVIDSNSSVTADLAK